VLLDVLERQTRRAYVQLTDLGALAFELAADDLGDEVERIVAERERCAEADGVLHDLVAPRLLALADLFERLLDDLHERDRIEAQVGAAAVLRLELDLAVVDDTAALVDLVQVAEVGRPATMMSVAGQRFVVERDEDVGGVAVRADVLVVDAHSVERVLSHDVRVVFDVRVNA